MASEKFRRSRLTRSAQKNHALTLKIIGGKRKCQFFHFSLLEIKISIQNQILRIILGIKPTFFVWIPAIGENKNITSSDPYHCFLHYFRFFGHFRLLMTFVTYPMQ